MLKRCNMTILVNNVFSDLFTPFISYSSNRFSASITSYVIHNWTLSHKISQINQGSLFKSLWITIIKSSTLPQQAAGIFSHLKETVLLALHGEPTPDLAPDTLAALAALMLAQAQEVIAYKCIQGECRPSPLDGAVIEFMDLSYLCILSINKKIYVKKRLFCSVQVSGISEKDSHM